MLTQLRHLGVVKKILELGLTFYLVFECHVEMLCQWAYKGCQLAMSIQESSSFLSQLWSGRLHFWNKVISWNLVIYRLLKLYLLLCEIRPCEMASDIGMLPECQTCQVSISSVWVPRTRAESILAVELHSETGFVSWTHVCKVWDLSYCLLSELKVIL